MLCLGLIGVLLPNFTYAQSDISPAAALQIQSLLDEKASRTAVQKKMGSQLWYALKMERKQAITPLVETLEVEKVQDAQGLVAVDIKSASSNLEPIVDFVKRKGGRIQSAHPRFRSVLAYMPLLEAENLAALPEVHFAELWVKPQNNSLASGSDSKGRKATLGAGNGMVGNASGPGGATVLAGNVVSEADETHLVSSTRRMYGVNGAGVKIGVLSDSYNILGGAATDVSQGELPGIGNPAGFTTPVTLLTEGNGADEGRAMLQLIHDLAPGAQLYCASAFNGDADFAQQILNLRAAGCDIIVDDITYFNEPAFQDGIIAQAVNQVTANGALYFSSAGNSGNLNDNTSGVWEGDFTDGGTLPLLTTGTVHAFSAGNTSNSLTTNGRPYLKWSDPLGLSGNDYDLFALNSTGTTVIASSTNIQDGNDDPLEFTGSLNSGRRLVVLKKPGAAVRALHLNTNRGKLAIGTTGVTFGHNAGKSTVCVAATPAPAVFPNPHTTSNATETFSSDGPRRIFYRPDTSAITPGNLLFATNGGEKLQKPDLTAADGTNTTVPNFIPFYGTSAAAPHAAAIAGLLKSKTPSLTSTQIYNALIASALDIEAPGLDENSGAGIIMAPAAMAASGASPVFADVVKISETIKEGTISNGNQIPEPGEMLKISIRLRNHSSVAAQNVKAIISSTDPTVTILQNAIEVALLNGLTDTSNNLIPFQLGISSAQPCGSQITVTVKLIYSNISVDTIRYSIPISVGTRPYQNISSDLSQSPASIPGVETSSGTIGNRFAPNQIASSCASPKTNPGTFPVPSPIAYHAYTFTNNSGTSQCVELNQSNGFGSNLYTVVYDNNGFQPASVSNNYLADAGKFAASQIFSFTSNPGEKFTAVVYEVLQGSGAGIVYTLKNNLALCSPAPACAPITVANRQFCGLKGQPINITPEVTGGSGFYESEVTSPLPAGISFSNGTFTGTFANSGSFTARIRYKDRFSCPQSQQIQIQFRISETIKATASDTALCEGETLVLQGSPAPLAGMTYTWSDGVQNGIPFVPTASKTYQLTSTFGNCIQTDSVRVVVKTRPFMPVILPFGPTSFCEGDSVVLQSSASTGNVWNTGATSQEITVYESGNYAVQVVQNGCSSPISPVVAVEVNAVPPKPVISANGPTSFCEGSSVTLQSSATSGNLWSNGETSPSITISTNEILNLRVVAGVCTSAVSDPVETIVNPVPFMPVILPIGPTTFCEGGSVLLQSSAPTGNVWSNGATSQEITVSNSGDYSVQVVLNGCSSAVSPVVPVLVQAKPLVQASPDQTISAGQSVTLSATGAESYQWSPLSGLIPSNGQGASVLASPTSTTLYIVTGTSANGCVASDSVLVTVSGVLPPLTPPVISPGTGTYTGPVTVSISGGNGANLYYTTNGNVPRTDVPNSFTRLYTGPFQISSNATVRAIAVRGSEVTSPSVAFLTVSNPAVCDPPVISPGTGTYSSIQTITMSTATVGAEIWYTTNGNLPLFSVPNSFTRRYTGPFQVDRTTTINAVAIKTGVQNSSNVRATLTINLAETIGPVVFSPAPGIYAAPTSVSMSCNVAEAQIYYTTNGNTPRIDVFNYFTRLYSTPVAISASTTFKAMGVKTGLVNGPVTNGVYTFSASRKATETLELGFYPNPARDRVFVSLQTEYEKEARLEIYDLQGRRMHQQDISADGSTQEIRLSGLPSGLYLVKVQTESQQISRQLIKE